MVDVLGLDDGVQVVLQDAREVILQLAASEVRQDLLPVRRALQRPRICLSSTPLWHAGLAERARTFIAANAEQRDMHALKQAKRLE